MVTVEFLGPIGLEPVSFEASTLRELSEMIKKEIPAVKDWLTSSAVALNDVLVESLDTKLSDGDRVSLIPPVCGG